MTAQKQIILRKTFTNRVKLHTDNEDWKALVEIYPGAEEAGVPAILLKKTALKIADYVYSKKRYHESIIFLNKARIRDPKSKKIFQAFVDSIDIFFKYTVEELSKNDLAEFKQAILPIINFHKVNFPEHRQIIESTDHLFRRIDYRIEYVAKDVQESKVTFRVQQIKNALYDDDMTIEQVRQEAARLLAPTLRRMYDEYEKKEEDEKDKKKKATDKKKKEKKKEE
ncbi:MAG: hypothetical protein HND40_00225 [Ignavibacteriota bacterium]|nr:hypothetical protein [Ignavibacteriota bacterium]MCO6447997.1 hypothetical protein [Ignavibacterium album]MCZ2268384.1 hypothetical protein [Ignavibacteriales bacterium]QKJ98089.1 MAG: hypothetical protein HND40_00225 [Ignavibacteriota bacterium]HOJ06764.1 hypothetical protein [Ignavibacteriaceae bacterium]